MKITLGRFVYIVSIAMFLSFSAAVIAGEYEGSWLLYDTHGNGVEATFSADGAASGTHGDAMKHGAWKEVDGAVVITWKTGWATRIAKEGVNMLKLLISQVLR
jgi:hypothetical protein